jgi:hypothetical protein
VDETARGSALKELELRGGAAVNVVPNDDVVVNEAAVAVLAANRPEEGHQRGAARRCGAARADIVGVDLGLVRGEEVCRDLAVQPRRGTAEGSQLRERGRRGGRRRE